MAYSNLPPEQRFFNRVQKSDDPNACWLWTGGISTYGYGRLAVGGKHIAAHRFAYELYVGAIPDGLYVCHTCDVRNCVNPAHLWLGTAKDNSQDMARKGRNGRYTQPERTARGDRHGAHLHPERLARGERVGTSKLAAGDVSEIRRRYSAGGISYRALGKEYGVSEVMIGNIVRRKWWQHID